MVGRDAKGRFVKGESGNPQGRLPKEIEKTYLQVCEGVCSFDVWREIVMKAVEQAKRGDARARQWLSDYLMGKPISMVMAVQEKQENVLIVKYAIQEKLRKIADENSDKPITVNWSDAE